MELKLTIPQRPRLMHVLPVMDLVVLVFTFPLIVSQFSSMGGHKMELADSMSRIPSVDHALVIEILPGEPVQIWLNKEKVELADLGERLEIEETKWIYGGDPVVLLKIDQTLTQSDVAAVKNTLLAKKFAVWAVENLTEP